MPLQRRKRQAVPPSATSPPCQLAATVCQSPPEAVPVAGSSRRRGSRDRAAVPSIIGKASGLAVPPSATSPPVEVGRKRPPCRRWPEAVATVPEAATMCHPCHRPRPRRRPFDHRQAVPVGRDRLPVAAGSSARLPASPPSATVCQSATVGRKRPPDRKPWKPCQLAATVGPCRIASRAFLASIPPLSRLFPFFRGYSQITGKGKFRAVRPPPIRKRFPVLVYV